LPETYAVVPVISKSFRPSKRRADNDALQIVEYGMRI